MHAEDILGLSVPAMYFLMYAAERVWPRRQFPKKSGWGWGFVGVGFLGIAMTMGIVAPLLLPVDWLAKHRLVDGTKLGVVGGTIAGILVAEFVVYWFHRGNHTLSFMWRFVHQMHHAPSRLDIPGSMVFHPNELVLQNVLSVGVMTLVLGLDPLAAALTGLFLGFSALFQHWNVKTPHWLGYIVQRPEAHAYHHGMNVHAMNYSDLPLWDIVFGTFRNPKDFDGEVGFAQKPSYLKMLVGVDVSV